MRFRLALSVAAVTLALMSPSVCLANRTWHDIYGGTLRGTFKGLNERTAEIQTSSQLVRIPFWNLTIEDQKFIARRMRDWRQNEKVPEIAALPRDWMIDDQAVAGQLLRVEGQNLWIVVDGRKCEFSLSQLSDADARHARDWIEPVIQKTKQDRRDPFVKDDGIEAKVESEESPVLNEPAGDSPWLTHRSFRLGITALVCLTAFAWRILRRALPGNSDFDF